MAACIPQRKGAIWEEEQAMWPGSSINAVTFYVIAAIFDGTISHSFFIQLSANLSDIRSLFVLR